MKFITKILFISFIAILLTACSSSPKHINSNVSNVATIRGDVANFFKYLGSGESHVHILEIDGVETGSSPYRLAPGKHTLGISAIGDRGEAKSYIDVVLQPNTEYKITAKTVGISMVFKLWDITFQNPVLVKTIKIKTSQPATPIYIPVII